MKKKKLKILENFNELDILMRMIIIINIKKFALNV